MDCSVRRWFCVVLGPKPPLYRQNWLSFINFQDTERFLVPCPRHFQSCLPPSGETCKYSMVPITHTNTERFSTYWNAIFSCVCLRSEIPEGLRITQYLGTKAWRNVVHSYNTNENEDSNGIKKDITQNLLIIAVTTAIVHFDNNGQKNSYHPVFCVRFATGYWKPTQYWEEYCITVLGMDLHSKHNRYIYTRIHVALHVEFELLTAKITERIIQPDVTPCSSEIHGLISQKMVRFIFIHRVARKLS
jgi:hypothetical protein